jgi:ABC-type arginine transport system permease subunit
VANRRIMQGYVVGNAVVKKKPDLIVVLLAVFGLGVALTLLVPMSASRSVAEPISPLHAGVINPQSSNSN